jgi:hypothetical protein
MDALRRHGVDHIFGYPGGAILPIYDELHKAEARGWLKHIRAAPTPPMPTPAPPAESGSVSAPPAPAPPTW